MASEATPPGGFICDLCGEPIAGLTRWAGLVPGGLAPRHERGLCPNLPLFHETKSSGRYLILVTYFDTPKVPIEARVLFRTAAQAARAAVLLRALRFGGAESEGAVGKGNP